MSLTLSLALSFALALAPPGPLPWPLPCLALAPGFALPGPRPKPCPDPTSRTQVSLADDLSAVLSEWCTTVQLTDEAKIAKVEAALRTRLDAALAQAWQEQEEELQAGGTNNAISAPPGVA